MVWKWEWRRKIVFQLSWKWRGIVWCDSIYHYFIHILSWLKKHNWRWVNIWLSYPFLNYHTKRVIPSFLLPFLNKFCLFSCKWSHSYPVLVSVSILFSNKLSFSLFSSNKDLSHPPWHWPTRQGPHMISLQDSVPTLPKGELRTPKPDPTECKFPCLSIISITDYEEILAGLSKAQMCCIRSMRWELWDWCYE